MALAGLAVSAWVANTSNQPPAVETTDAHRQQAGDVPATLASQGERPLGERVEAAPEATESSELDPPLPSLSDLGRELAQNPDADVGLTHARVWIRVLSNAEARDELPISSNVGTQSVEDIVSDISVNPRQKKLSDADRERLSSLLNDFRSMSRELYLDRHLAINQIVEQAILAKDYVAIPRQGAKDAIEQFDLQYGPISRDFTWTEVPGSDFTHSRRVRLYRARYPELFEMNDYSHRLTADLQAALREFFKAL